MTKAMSGAAPKSAAPVGGSPLTGLAFAKVYETVADPLTTPVSILALERLSPIEPGASLLDIAAGTGALAVPAAEQGLAVLGVDLAPGMVERLAERLQPFDNAEARIMDGQSLDVADESYDIVASMFGLQYMKDWKQALSEMLRVLKPGGRACIAGWATLDGGPPAGILRQAFRVAFPDVALPKPSDGMVALSDPSLLQAGLIEAGFVEVTLEEVDRTWRAPSGSEYLDAFAEFHSFFPPYAAAPEADRRKVDEAIVDLTRELAEGGRLELPARMLLTMARKP